MGSDAFQGAWRVRESVFAPDGAKLGEVSQHRRVVAGAEGRARVIQDCVPDAALASHASHPMARFAGHHEFELRREGTLRRYEGPAVIGGAVSLGDGAMMGRGLWPAFGWGFTSWSVMVAPRRQLTGGRFFRGGHSMASIVGVATPEEDARESAPRLGHVRSPATLASRWKGTFVRVDGAGSLLLEGRVARRYADPDQWSETGAPGEDLRIQLGTEDGVPRVRGAVGAMPLHGMSHRYGTALEIDAAAGGEWFLETQEILDGEGEHLVVLRRWLVDHVPQRLDVLRLRPEEGT